MQRLLEPANSIIEALGGNAVVREITGLSRTRVYRWTQPKVAGGTDGLIPPKEAIKLLRYADANGIPLSAGSFLPLDYADEAQS